MKLIKFRVTEFRSVEDSGWIDVGQIATLIGANESGKTNLMKALWNLNPGEDTHIDPIEDMPRAKYYSMISAPIKPVFITAAFELNDEEIRFIKVSTLASSSVRYCYIGRDYDNRFHYEFLETGETEDAAQTIMELAKTAAADCERADAVFASSARAAVLKVLSEIMTPTQNSLSSTVHLIYSYLAPFVKKDLTRIPGLLALIEDVVRRDQLSELSLNTDVQVYLKSRIPLFLFYASAGNLDGEIYLPQMCDNLRRGNLRGHEVDRVRTARKFFSMLNNTPEHLLELGHGIMDALADETQIEYFLKLKEESEAILNAAEARFNRVFNHWSGGNLRFDFKMDGEYLRVRVLDDADAEPIELEHRSEWVQWMFSFCINLIGAENRDFVLILDEPELALHPLSQKELLRLLESKSEMTQVVFCTHSPFFINKEHLDRVTNVYNDERGYTVTGDDLRISSRGVQIEACFALSSAVTLGVSEALMFGCVPVLVETVSDQVYLSLFKNLLASTGELGTRREIVFIPCGGVGGVKAILPLLVGKNNFLPAFVAGGDRAALIREVIADTGVFRRHPNRAITVGEESETRFEDLVPRALYIEVFERYLEEKVFLSRDMDYLCRPSIIASIEAMLSERNYRLPTEWRAEVGQRVKQEMVRVGTKPYVTEKGKWQTIRRLFAELVKL